MAGRDLLKRVRRWLALCILRALLLSGSAGNVVVEVDG
jgi:hypothetical protein